MTPAVVKGLIERRPFKSVVELNKFLLEQKLTPDQAKEFYRKAFVPINLNTGTREEFMLIPGVGSRMAAELAEYRPVEDLGAVRQGNRQICRPAGNRPAEAIRVHSAGLITPGDRECGGRRRRVAPARMAQDTDKTCFTRVAATRPTGVA